MGWRKVPADQVKPGDLVRTQAPVSPGRLWRVSKVLQPFDDLPLSIELARWLDVDDAVTFEVNYDDQTGGEGDG